MTGHLTDEQLSAHLDGESDTDSDGSAAQFAEHLATCARCRRRLSEFDAVRNLVQTPVVPPSPNLRAESIATVLRSAAAGGAGIEGRVDARAGRGAIDGDGTADGNGTADGTGDVSGNRPIKMPGRRPQVLVGAAAAILVLATAIGVPLALLGRSTSTSSSAGRSAAALGASTTTTGPSQTSGHQSASGTYGGSTSSGVPSFGEVASVEALRARVDGLLFVTGSVAAAPATTTGTNAAAATPTTTVPPSPTSLGKGSVPADQGLSSLTAGAPSAIEFQRCLSSAMHAAGPTTSVQLVATAAFMGTPALVYAFQPSSSASTSGSPSTSGDAARSAVVVTAVDGCRILVTTTE